MKTNHLLAPKRRRIAAAFAACSLLVTNAFAASFFDAGGVAGVSLGTARGGSQALVPPGNNWNWAALTLGTINISNSTNNGSLDITGDVGTQGTVSLTNANLGGFNGLGTSGKLMQRTGTSLFQTNSTIAGGVFKHTSYNTHLSTAWSNAVSASTAAWSKNNNPTTGFSIVTGMTSTLVSYGTMGFANINAAGQAVSFAGLGAANTTYVIRLSNLILSNAILTLTGTSTTNYIINVNKSLALSFGAQIALSGGIQAQNVLFNVRNNSTVNGTGVTLSGGSTLNGIILAVGRSVTMSGASKVIGSVVSKTLNMSGHSKIKNPLVSP